MILRPGPVTALLGKFVILEDPEKDQDNMASKQANWPYVINLGNSIIGVSVLAMPFCFRTVSSTATIALTWSMTMTVMNK